MKSRNPYLQQKFPARLMLGAALIGILAAIGALTLGAWFLRMVLG